ncbi:MAG: hypothetical protein IH898_06355 [Planctomycetes bacterium]|nr:hypothetical protein [Planctomycetota bacterium]
MSPIPCARLGGKDTPEESFYRVVSAIVGTDDNGNMYVLDPDAYQVQVFDSIGRHLRTAYRHDPGFGAAPPPRNWGPEALASPTTGVEHLRAVKERSSHAAVDDCSPTFTSRLVGLLLVAGVIGFAGGAGLLVWAAAFQLPGPWQWGMTATIAAEGALILGLTWMAGRLWRNSRQLNRQLAGFENQLDEIEHLTGSLAGSRMSSSQHYYDHFNQGASSHMLLANLRGQVDQLASRMGV